MLKQEDFDELGKALSAFGRKAMLSFEEVLGAVFDFVTETFRRRKKLGEAIPIRERMSSQGRKPLHERISSHHWKPPYVHIIPTARSRL